MSTRYSLIIPKSNGLYKTIYLILHCLYIISYFQVHSNVDRNYNACLMTYFITGFGDIGDEKKAKLAFIAEIHLNLEF